METKKHPAAALAVAALAAAAALVLVAPGAGRATPETYPAESCYDASIDCGTAELETGVVAEPLAAYAYSGGICRTRYARATRRNLFRFVVFRYNEQVRWCWSGGVITYFSRDRWPSDTSFGWGFYGHIGSNCVLEHCTGRGVGSYSTDAWTQGDFGVCLKGFCPHKYPIVDIWVHGDGGSGASWSGA
jgi:hypothetical protein